MARNSTGWPLGVSVAAPARLPTSIFLRNHSNPFLSGLPSRPRAQTRQNFGVVELDGLIYVLGGENEVTELTSVEVFDPHFNTWKPQTSMTMVRSVSAAPARPPSPRPPSP